MSKIEGVAADEHLARGLAEDKCQAETLARAKADAQRAGRERFDLVKHATHAELAPMEELARHVEESSRW